MPVGISPPVRAGAGFDHIGFRVVAVEGLRPDDTARGVRLREVPFTPERVKRALETSGQAPSTVLSARQLGQEGPNEVPLLVGEITGMRRIRKGHPSRMARVIRLLTPTSPS